MNKTQRDLIIASVLVPACVVAFSVNVLKIGKKDKLPEGQADAVAAGLEQTGAQNLVFMTNLRSHDAALKEQEKFWEGEFGQDPFAVEAQVAEQGDIESLDLRGIFLEDENPKALINGKMLSKGEVIEGYSIVEIKAHSVVFSNGEKNEEVLLFREAVSQEEIAPPVSGEPS